MLLPYKMALLLPIMSRIADDGHCDTMKRRCRCFLNVDFYALRKLHLLIDDTMPFRLDYHSMLYLSLIELFVKISPDII